MTLFLWSQPPAPPPADMSAAASSLRRAITGAGGPVVLARAMGGITSQAIGQWFICPPRRVLLVERLTGVPRHELRPDLYPPPADAPSEAA